ncbi:MAG: AI-2E family transporter [Candidatus Marinimicrobia bacterium]|nr:AI-2E family transporter [Candidatus Neomarinimicrobiota bacterium]
MTDTTPQKFYRLLLILIGIGFLYLIWSYISTVVLLLIFAFLLTTILLPIVDWLEARLKSRGIAVLTTVVTLLAVIIIFLSSFVMQISQEAVTTARDFNQDELVQAIHNLRSFTIDKMPAFVRDMFQSNSDYPIKADKISGYVKTILQSLSQLGGATVHFFFLAILLLIFTVIILYEYHNFKRSLVSFIPNKYFEIGLRLVQNIESQVSSYLNGQLMAAINVAILSIVGLWLLNVSVGANLTLIIFIGIIAGVANLIPLIGPFAGMIPAILIAVMNNLHNDAALSHHLFNFIPIPSPFFILDIILMFLIVQQIDNNFVTPKLVGKSVGMHPLIVIVALLIGASVMGPVGMLIAVPVAGTIRVVLKEITWGVRNAHLL